MQVKRMSSTLVESANGLYQQRTDAGGWVSISCEMTGLTDTTRGKVGLYNVYLQNPSKDVSDELIQGAREFSRSVREMMNREEAERQEAIANYEDRLYGQSTQSFPYRTSEEAWEAEDEEAWAQMQRAGL